MQVNRITKENIQEFVEKYGRLGDMLIQKITWDTAFEYSSDPVKRKPELRFELSLTGHVKYIGVGRLIISMIEPEEFQLSDPVYKTVVNEFNMAVFDGLTYINLQPYCELLPEQCDLEDFKDVPMMAAAREVSWWLE